MILSSQNQKLFVSFALDRRQNIDKCFELFPRLINLISREEFSKVFHQSLKMFVKFNSGNVAITIFMKLTVLVTLPLFRKK
jgi:hypothetical protein